MTCDDGGRLLLLLASHATLGKHVDILMSTQCRHADALSDGTALLPEATSR